MRSAWVGIRKSEEALRPVWPTWAFAAAAVFLLGFRVGLNVETPRGVIDVGLAGVVGASRILDGEAPYGNMPQRGDLEPCGPKDADGEVRERIQTNGRCEAGIERGDTYGPVSYVAYLPAVLVFEWSGKWDSLPAAHATSILFDVLTIFGWCSSVFASGECASPLCSRSPGPRIRSPYVLNANTNDTIMPALLVFGFWLASSAWARGSAVALAGWAKFGGLLLAPLWASYPELAPRRVLKFAVAFAVATVASFVILLLDPSLWRAIRTFWDCTVGFQAGRDSPFSLWGWGQYHAEGIPDLGFVQPALAVLAVAIAIGAAFLPREKGPIELAALTAAVLVAFQLSLTHWFYLYLLVPALRPALAPAAASWIRETGCAAPRSPWPCPTRSRSRSRRPRPVRRPEPLEADGAGRCATPDRVLRLDADDGAAGRLPASVMKAVPRARTHVGCPHMRVVPTTAVTRPSSQRASATFSLVASAWTSTRTSRSLTASSTRSSMTSNIEVAGSRKSDPRTSTTARRAPFAVGTTASPRPDTRFDMFAG